jgi:hypothetical protein
LIKFFYYTLFAMIFLVSVVIFFEILNVGILNVYIGDFILNFLDTLNF